MNDILRPIFHLKTRSHSLHLKRIDQDQHVSWAKFAVTSIKKCPRIAYN